MDAFAKLKTFLRVACNYSISVGSRKCCRIYRTTLTLAFLCSVILSMLENFLISKILTIWFVYERVNNAIIARPQDYNARGYCKLRLSNHMVCKFVQRLK